MSDIGKLTGRLLFDGLSFAKRAIERYPSDVQAALHQELEDGAALALTITLSPDPRLTLRIGELAVAEMTPEVDVSRHTLD